MHFWEAAYVQVVNNQFVMRLNKFFEKKDKYLGMYHKGEIIAHECSHVARMGYPESRFEEIFAYHLSKGFRKVFGPLFQSSYESLILILLVAVSITCDFVCFDNYKIILFSKAVLGLYLSLLSVRLFLRRRIFFKALSKIKKLVKNSMHGMALLFRLTDQEIVFFGKNSKDEIKKYISEQTELRWQIIRASYPIK
ncbi:MAG: hypothetical protein S4CHLAM6_03810 [Chlamydiae bacterium]|nr:hypothetical protein [Chlamydiota bacterium]